jgi:DNA-3-methyladenine glycosylase I
LDLPPEPAGKNKTKKDGTKIGAAPKASCAWGVTSPLMLDYHDTEWGVPVHDDRNRFKAMKDLPAKSPESEAMSRDLKARGFKFAGPTICYAFMQAAGLVNDHVVGCFRHRRV